MLVPGSVDNINRLKFIIGWLAPKNNNTLISLGMLFTDHSSIIMYLVLTSSLGLQINKRKKKFIMCQTKRCVGYLFSCLSKSASRFLHILWRISFVDLLCFHGFAERQMSAIQIKINCAFCGYAMHTGDETHFPDMHIRCSSLDSPCAGDTIFVKSSSNRT